jgi:hypothetical protein
MDLVLTRHAYLPGVATLGTLRAGDLVLATLERPWLPSPTHIGGRPGESCVPDGSYTLAPYNSNRFPNVWSLSSVAHGVTVYDAPTADLRSHVLIHAGNNIRDTSGCILVGRTHGFDANAPWIYKSRQALNDLRALLGDDDHRLTIRPYPGTSAAL